jgi:hypothetical protein
MKSQRDLRCFSFGAMMGALAMSILLILVIIVMKLVI